MTKKTAQKITEDGRPVMPKVEVYPLCSECKLPYVLRRVFVISPPRSEQQWLWQRDCKHKKAPPMMSNKTNEGTP